MKYTRKEKRAVQKIRDHLNRVRSHRRSMLAKGKKPDLEMKAEQGAIISLLITDTNGKYEGNARC